MRRRSALLALFLAGTAIPHPAHAGEEVLFGPPPGWVVDFEPAPGAATVSMAEELPVKVLLTDFQTRLEADRVTHFIAMDLQFVSSDGLSAGDISLSWRPEFDDLTVHRVEIVRAGQVIDVLAGGQTFTVLRREQSLEAATLTGVLTANMFPDGLEVGDVLRLAYSIAQDNPVLRGAPEAFLGPLNGVVEQSHARFSWPRSLPVAVSVGQGLPEPERGQRGDTAWASLVLPMQEPLLPPEGAPARFSMVRTFEAASLAGWNDVARIFVPLFRDASVIPAEGPLRSEVERIRTASNDPVRQAEMALALAQDRIRYVALAMGEGSLVPTDAATTWSRRYGDCKAKTALLLGILGELGIAAHPVLVNSVMGDTLPHRLPMVSAFDHVLVAAQIGDRTYYLDGTRTGDRSLARLDTPGFGWGLPVVDQGAGLVAMVAPPLAEPMEETVLRIDASGGLRAPAPATGELIMRGQLAVATNEALARLVGQQRRQAMEEYWSNNHPVVTPETVQMQFDAESGELRLSMTGSAELDWDYGNFEPSNVRVGMTFDFERPQGMDQDAPFVLAHPIYHKVTQEIVLPQGFTAANIEGDSVDQVVAGMSYRRQLGLENNVFTAVREVRSLVSELPAAEGRAAAPLLERLWENRVRLRIPAGYRMTRAEIDALSAADSEDPQELINQAVALMDMNEYAAARPILDKVTEIAPANPWGWANRSVVNARSGNVEATLADAERALAIDPGNYVARHGRAILASERGDSATARAELDAAIAARADNAFALRMRTWLLVQEREFDAALADARRLREIGPDDLDSWFQEAMVLSQAGRTADLSAYLAEMLARFPGHPAAQTLASELYAQAGMEEEADAQLAAAMENGPNPRALYSQAQRRPLSETAEKLQDLDRALELQADFVPALLLRAETLWAEYEYERALVDAERALVLMPAMLQAHSTRIRILSEMGRRRDALQAIDAMVAAVPQNAFALAMGARYAESLDAQAKAAELMAQAQAIDPDVNRVVHVEGL